MTVHNLLSKRLHDRAGLNSTPAIPGQRFTKELLDFVRQHKWSRRFEELMRQAFVMGSMRYETPEVARQAKFVGRPTRVQTEDIIRRIRAFQKDGNKERLVDAANLCMIEFETSDHPLAHYEGTDRKE